MSLADLISSLERDVDHRIDAMIADATTEAERITRDAAARSTIRTADELAAIDLSLRARAGEQVARERRLANHERIREHERVIDTIIGEAVACLPRLTTTPAYRESLAAQLATALSYTDPDGVRIRCSPSIAPLVERMRPDDHVTSDATIGSGFIVIAGDGRVEVDVTLESRLAALRRHVAVDVLRQIRED
jgi:vacuolar-type H+-ATPase subunit E/Vma4